MSGHIFWIHQLFIVRRKVTARTNHINHRNYQSERKKKSWWNFAYLLKKGGWNRNRVARSTIIRTSWSRAQNQEANSKKVKCEFQSWFRAMHALDREKVVPLQSRWQVFSREPYREPNSYLKILEEKNLPVKSLCTSLTRYDIWPWISISLFMPSLRGLECVCAFWYGTSVDSSDSCSA